MRRAARKAPRRAPLSLFARARFMALPGVMAMVGGAAALAGAGHGLGATAAHPAPGYGLARPDDLAPAPGGAGADVAR